MRVYAFAALAIAGLLLALFGLAHVLAIPLVGERSPRLGEAGVGAGLASFALLAGDVVLPVPSSALMILNGSLFGLAGGALLSLVGTVAAAVLGGAIGRRGGPALARRASPRARGRAALLVAEHGALAIVLTRPVPVVAETVAILAGAAGMPLRRLAVAATIGSLPPAIAYAFVGAYSERVEVTFVVLAGVLTLAAAFWLVEHRRGRSAADDRVTVSPNAPEKIS